jgi:hypothetical protein
MDHRVYRPAGGLLERQYLGRLPQRRRERRGRGGRGRNGGGREVGGWSAEYRVGWEASVLNDCFTYAIQGLSESSGQRGTQCWECRGKDYL